MSIEDEPIEGFFPHCAACGEAIDGDGYKIGDDYYCENCVEHINGYEVAEDNRESAYEDACSRFYGEDR